MSNKINNMRKAVLNSAVAIKKRDIEILNLKNEIDLMLLKESKDRILIVFALFLLFTLELTRWIF